MSPKLIDELRAMATQKLDHAKECEAKAKEYDAAARKMRDAAAADRALAAEIVALRVHPGAAANAQAAPLGAEVT
jgi:hypothetical protein